MLYRRNLSRRVTVGNVHMIVWQVHERVVQRSECPTKLLRVILIGEFFSLKNSTFVSRHFSTFHIFLFFYPNIGRLTNLIFLLWRIPRIVTERLRILIHIYNYFQTFGIFGKKRSPIRMSLRNKSNRLYITLVIYTGVRVHKDSQRPSLSSG